MEVNVTWKKNILGDVGNQMVSGPTEVLRKYYWSQWDLGKKRKYILKNVGN